MGGANLEAELVPPRRSLSVKLRKWVSDQPLGAVSAVGVIVMIVIAIFAPQISPYDPVETHYETMMQAPSAEYWLGTDQYGRDVLSRIIWGARTALYIGFTSAILGATLGLILGVASAYFSGWFDLVFQRIMDVFLAFPLIILALAAVAVFGTGPDKVILAIIFPFVPRCARVVRSGALAIREMPYVDAARALGYGHMRIIMRHMVPNCMATYLIMLTTFLGQAILIEASLSYLGLGVQEPTPAWGLMLQGGAEEYAESAIWIAVFPGLAITLAVFAFNLFGDALRDTLDPKLRSR
ncbi:MAG: ABC transporter permease subunit [Betaproteobacteria bacterium]|nr:ABC transporter permease subunit [Betaproteobacteria bacterium]